MAKIQGGVTTNFDKISQDMNKTADSLKQSAINQKNEAGQAVGVAGQHGVEVLTNLAGAGANAIFATSKFVEGIGTTAAAGAEAAAAGGYVAAGVAGWTTEGVREGGQYVAKQAARGFGGIANAMTRIIGDGKQTTVRELQGDPTAQRFSERMFGKAADKLQLSSDTMNAAWNAYGEALIHASGVGGNLVLAAGHAAGVAVNLGKAAALTTSAGATKLAEFGVRVGSTAVQAAEQGVMGARDLIDPLGQDLGRDGERAREPGPGQGPGRRHQPARGVPAGAGAAGQEQPRPRAVREAAAHRVTARAVQIPEGRHLFQMPAFFVWGGPQRRDDHQPKTNFDRTADALSADAGKLSQKVENNLQKAAVNLGKAGEAKKDAFEALAQAGAEIALGADKVVEGGGNVVDAVGNALQGIGYGAAGVGGWALEGVAEGVRYTATNLAKGFAAIANFLSNKDGTQVLVQEIEGDPNAQRFSDRMFDKAKGEFKQAGGDLQLAWNAWSEAVGHAATSGADLAVAAGHVAGVAANLVTAAGRYGLAALDTVAAAGVELASAAVRAAGEGVEGARDLSILSAKFSASVANLMANPGDPKLEVVVKQQLEGYGRELKTLVERQPDLAPDGRKGFVRGVESRAMRHLMALVGLLALPAEAHFRFLLADGGTIDMYNTNTTGDPVGGNQKTNPCGSGTQMSNITTTLTAGQTYGVRIQETITHGGHYRVAIAQNMGMFPPARRRRPTARAARCRRWSRRCSSTERCSTRSPSPSRRPRPSTSRCRTRRAPAASCRSSSS